MTSRPHFPRMLTLCVILCACSDEPRLPTPVNSEVLNSAGNVTLRVSNASHTRTVVDIQVTIDGELIVSNFFALGGSATPSAYVLALSPGRHTIRAVSEYGDAELVRHFTVTDGMHWADLEYEYAPWYSDTPRAPRFQWMIQDRPIEFL